MKLTDHHDVESTMPSLSPSDAACGSCPSTAALSASAIVTRAVSPPWEDTARSVQMAPFALDSGADPLPSTGQHTHHAQPVTQAGNKSGPAPTVLVVEDDLDISMALQDLLEFEGYQVDCAHTCRQAFSFIEQHTYDVVLLDLGLPDGDGRSVLEKLHTSHPTLPVIILTAATRDLGPLQAFAKLTKPWKREELREVLRRAVRTASAQPR